MYVDDQKKYLMTKLGLSGFYGMNDLISLYLKDRLGSDYDSVGQHEFYFRRPFTNVLRTINDQLFFTGDGSTNSAELVMPDGSSVEGKYLRSLHIYQTNWQGRVELSDQPRTNRILQSSMLGTEWDNRTNMTSAVSPYAAPDGNGYMTRTTYTTPSGMQTSIVNSLGSAVVGQDIILRCFVRRDGNRYVELNGFGNGSYGVTFDLQSGVSQINDNWKDAGIKLISNDLALVWGRVIPGSNDVAYFTLVDSMSGGSVSTTGQYVDWWGAMLLSGDADPLGAYIPTTNSPVTVTDYTRSGSTITFGQTPAQGATEEWSGAVYNHPITIESRKGTPLSDLVVERIEHKEGSDSFSILTEGTDYTISGDTVTLDPEYKPTDCFYTGYAK